MERAERIEDRGTFWCWGDRIPNPDPAAELSAHRGGDVS